MPLAFLMCPGSFGLRQVNLVLIAYASSEGSGEPAHPKARKPDPWPL